jgi:polysaccharide biosynthesis transport protein
MENEVAGASLQDKVARGLVLSRRVIRRWPLALLVGLLAGGGVLGFFLFLKKGYFISRTYVQFRESVQQDVVRGGEVRESFDLVQAMARFMSSRTTLLSIARESSFLPENTNMSETELVDLLHGQINRTAKADSFTFEVRGGDPVIVQRMTKNLADRFIRENVAELSRKPNETAAFINRQTADASREVKAIEEELFQFKELHQLTVDQSGQLVLKRAPTARTVGVSRAIRDAAKDDVELKDALARKGQLEAQLAVLAGSPSGPDTSAKEEELSNAKRTLEGLLRSFTEAHPDVIAARKRVRALEDEAAAERKRLGSARAETQEERDLRATIAGLDVKISQRMKELNARQNSVVKSTPAPKPDDKAAQSAAEFEQSAAQIESKFAELTRSLAIHKAKQSALEERANEASPLAKLATEKSAEAFSIIDPAVLPVKPVRPRRMKIAIMALAAAIFAGLGAALARVLLDPKIYDEDDLKQACRLPVLASIPRRTIAQK